MAASAKKVSRSQVEEEEEEEEKDDAASDDGSDNDLFDSDEEAAISSRFKKGEDEEDDEEEEEEVQPTGRLKRGSASTGAEDVEKEGKREKVTREKIKANWDDDEGDYASEEDVRGRRTMRGSDRDSGRDRGRERDDSDDSDSGARRERERDERNRLAREEDDNSPEADLIDHQKIMVRLSISRSLLLNCIGAIKCAHPWHHLYFFYSPILSSLFLSFYSYIYFDFFLCYNITVIMYSSVEKN